ncbi:type II toxin-antitoxin system VapC family toxin [Geodermatophilus sp. URMC 64]
MIFLADTSVVLKWVHEDGESDVEAARRLLDAHRGGTALVLLLDLAVYEFGNVLLRALRQPAREVVDQVELLRRLCGPFVHPAPSWLAEAARLGEQHRLTYYDAAWAAAARALDCPLVSADRGLLAAGLAIPLPEAVAVLP